ncbi:MAG: fumarylacetoacetate hydrolase family protein [Candidatus Tectomicrobia bacterium]|uniref:Fumarylacetoacetate hydrolase family protein n=1 Tax=Tectimicrobiota bacterium TaxID=2528274 RepID=A0A933GM01_UNCTE|nr:fumarylacetoacetate hydrolase family protein [Candidatus Tectomicrobia bacterium]
MKLVTYVKSDEPGRNRIGVVIEERVIDLAAAQLWAQKLYGFPSFALPLEMMGLISSSEALNYMAELIRIIVQVGVGSFRDAHGQASFQEVELPLNKIRLKPPITRPATLRDFYAFEEHVKTAYANRGSEIPPEWYKFPAFYFSNPGAILGPDDEIPRPRASKALDYELEIACVIGKSGLDIPVERAEEFIAGYMIMNDWSARDIQREEMKLLLGPAKGKDFATSLGPYLVTKDEIEDIKVTRGEGGCLGSAYDLQMIARVNGIERSSGNWKNIYYTFSEMIARASAGTYLFPGDVIGSGTVGTGCLLELTRGSGPWLEPGDVVELEVERLGVLKNVIRR